MFRFEAREVGDAFYLGACGSQSRSGSNSNSCLGVTFNAMHNRLITSTPICLGSLFQVEMTLRIVQAGRLHQLVRIAEYKKRKVCTLVVPQNFVSFVSAYT